MTHPVIEHLGRLVGTSPDSLRVQAKRCGVSHATLHRMARGENSENYKLDSVSKVAEMFGLRLGLTRRTRK